MSFNDWEKLGQAAERYEHRFGERPPLFEMPAEPEGQLAAIERALEAGEPIRADLPEDAVA